MEPFDKTEFWNLLFNGLSLTQFIVYMIFTLVGVILHFAMDVNRSMNYTESTPKEFKFWFAIKDNVLRGMGVGLFVIVNIIFYKEITGQDLTPYTALIFGYAIDSIVGHGALRAKTSGQLGKSREELLKRYK